MESDNQILEMMKQLGNVKRVSLLTGYSYSYIHQVMAGNLRPGSPLRRKIKRLYKKTFPVAGRKSIPTVTIRYDDPDQQKKHLQLSNTQRIRALELYYIEHKAHQDIEKAKKAILLDTNSQIE